MTTPNPFDPYRLLGCYGATALPEAPWWQESFGALWRRGHRHVKQSQLSLDKGETLLDAARAVDRDDPLPRPPVLPGQVWARYIDPLATDAHPDSTRWFLQPIDFGRIRQDGDTEGGRDLTTHMADRGAVLVYGPGAPWAPPEWAPGKVWDGGKWVGDAEGAPDGPT